MTNLSHRQLSSPQSNGKKHSRNHLAKFFVDFLRTQKKRFFVIAIALTILSISQTLFLFTIGPLLQVLFTNLESGSILSLQELMPPRINALGLIPDLSLPVERISVTVPIVILVAGILRSLATYAYQLNQQSMSLAAAKFFRDQLFDAIIRQNYLSFGKKSAGQWMSLIMNDVLFLQTRFSEFLSGVIRDVVLVFSCMLALFLIHIPSALTLILVGPLVGYYMGRIGRKIARYAESFQDRLAEIAAILLDIRKRFEFARAQEGEKIERRFFDVRNSGYYQAVKQSILVRASFAPSLEWIGFAIFAALVFLLDAGSTWQTHQLVPLFAAVGMALRPLRNIGEQLTRFHETQGALKQSLSTLTEALKDRSIANRSPHQDQPHASTLPTPITIKRLSWYHQGVSLLEIEDLTIERGQMIAIAGASGSGKSSFVRTLTGIIEPSCFETNTTSEKLRLRSALVSQEPFLFHDTIRANLNYGLPDNLIDDAAMMQALDVVDLKDHVNSLEKRLDNIYLTITSNLSGGQAQRLATARALLRDADILIFDEATSAIDRQTEEKLIQYLRYRSETTGATVLFVTHKLYLLEYFDRVLEFSDGKLRHDLPAKHYCQKMIKGGEFAN